MRRPLSRRSLLLGAGGLGAAAALSACGADGTSAQTGDDGPKRVVALSTGHLDHCLALGTVPVGLAVVAPEASNSTGIPQFIRDAFGDKYDLDAIRIVGERMTPDPEKIAALKPDLILSNKRADKSLNEQLAKMAPTVLTAGGEHCHGMTANAFSSVSLDPLLARALPWLYRVPGAALAYALLALTTTSAATIAWMQADSDESRTVSGS